MIERKQRRSYWRNTKLQLAASLAPFLLYLIAVPASAEALNSHRFLGFPLGYLLTLHGLWLVALVTVATFVNRQDAIDQWHGAQEDK